MKYIRTKDGIYEFVDFPKTDSANHYGYKDKKTGINMLMTLNESKKYSQADTIEELCDFFLIWDKNQHNGVPVFVPPNKDLLGVKMLLLEGMRRGYECWLRGAIWTDKGLIYVARMNKEGELELL